MLKKLTVFLGALAFVAVMAAVGDQADARKNKTEGGVYVCHFDKNHVQAGEVLWLSGLDDSFLGDLSKLEITDTKASLRNHLTSHEQRGDLSDDYICVNDVEPPTQPCENDDDRCGRCVDCAADFGVESSAECPANGTELNGAEAYVIRNPDVELGECDAP